MRQWQNKLTFPRQQQHSLSTFIQSNSLIDFFIGITFRINLVQKQIKQFEIR
jgi:hypothetical protein